LGSPEKAIENFSLALNIFISSRSDQSFIAEVHYHFADALEQRGDYDSAIEHAQKCRRLRETSFGFADIRVIHSCRQVSKMLLAPYKDYKGVLTVAIKASYREAISCHEKVFRYLQNQQGLSRKKSRKMTSKLTYISKSMNISGPMVDAPYGWTPPFAKNLMHKLTKDIVKMKLDLVEDPKLKECIRTLRQRRFEMLESSFPNQFDAEDARGTIMKMASVTPSVYLDDVLQRLCQGDDSAVEELFMVIILTESETVGFKSQ
jgi:tetratricopeptide (TPR) repeat protein